MIFKKLSMILCVLLALCSTAQAKWVEARSKNFIIVTDGGEKYATEKAQDLETYRYFLSKITGVPFKDEVVPVKVMILKSSKDFMKLHTGGKGVGGFYGLKISGPIFLASGKPTSSELSLSGEQIIKHEFVHHYTYSNSDILYPAWYREGIADFYSTFAYEKGTAYVGRAMGNRILSLNYDKWKPWDDIVSKPNWRIHKKDTTTAYAQSWLAAHYLQMHPEYSVKLRVYLGLIVDGVPSEQAWDQAFGESPNRLGQKFRGYYNKKRFIVKTFTFTPEEIDLSVKITPLSKKEASGEKIYYASFFGLYSNETQKKQRKGYKETLIPLLDESMKIKWAWRLAIMHLTDDEVVEAESVLANMQSSDPNHHLTHYVHGRILEHQHNFLAARKAYDESRHAKEDFSPAHFYYAQTFLKQGDQVTESAVAAIQIADSLTAENRIVPYTYAALLKRFGYKDEGDAILRKHMTYATNESWRKLLEKELSLNN